MKRISKFAAVLIFCLGIEVSAAQPNGDAPTTGDSARKETEKAQQCGLLSKRVSRMWPE
jgi:hypothetical protein